jgi:spore maturation protein CgeB
MYKPDPFVPGRHYVSATVEEMPDVIRYYLAHDDERQRIVDEGYRLVTQEATMANSVRRLMELISLPSRRFCNLREGESNA